MSEDWPQPMHYSPGPPWPAECGAGFEPRTNQVERVTCAACLRAIGKEKEDDWYAAHHCTHAHCPFGCDVEGKAQPDMIDGELYCMRCLIRYGRRTIMVPCVPEICGGES